MHGKSELPIHYQRTARPIVAMGIDHTGDWTVPLHRHRRAQLVFALSGVMLVSTATGRWIVPPSRAVWIPPGRSHSNRMLGSVRFRTVYVEASEALHLPKECRVVTVSPLLRELIQEAVKIGNDYAAAGRDARLMRLIVDEIRVLDALPLSLPMPRERRARALAERLLGTPGEKEGLGRLAKPFAASARTLERIFKRETGLAFGRWRRHARLQASLPLLAAGSGILQAALAVGYDSPSAFAAAFRKEYGVPPSCFFEAGVPSNAADGSRSDSGRKTKRRAAVRRLAK